MTTTIGDLLIQAAGEWGLILRRDGQKLVLLNTDRMPSDLRDLLREHKAAVLQALDPLADKTSPEPSCSRWLTIAAQVAAGEFDGCSVETRQEMEKALKTIDRPVCKQALRRLANPAKEAA